MSFPRYPKYKDSGVAWVGDIPDAWRTTRLKNLFELMRRAPESDDEIVTAFRDGEVTLRSNRRTDGFTNAVHEHGYQRVLPDDLVIHAMDAFAGAIGASDSVGKSTPVYSVCRQRDPSLNVWYFARLLRHMALSGFILSLAKGIRERSTEFRWNEAANVLIPVPSFQEQRAIATFLDRETAKIDALVAKQRQLIELLQEKRQAVISHAVTKGLNPDAPMRPSGIDWLGDVPEHWEVRRLKHVSPFITVGIVVNPSTYVTEAGLPFIYGGDICEGTIDWQNARRISAADSVSNSKTMLKEGDLLVVRVGAPGVTSVVPRECEGGNCASVMLIRQGNFSSEWLCYVMNTRVVRYQVEVVQYGAAQEQFNISHAVDFWVPYPPRAEQNSISQFLADKTEHFQSLIEEAELAINLLQERRTALISAAVTGKIDVRGLVDISGA